MSIWYTVSGELQFWNTPEAEAAVKRLAGQTEQHRIDLHLIGVGGGQMKLAIRGSDRMTASTAVDIDEALQAMGPYVVRPAKIRTSCDYEEDDYWVGKPKEIEEAVRREKIGEARKLLEGLTPEDRFEAILGVPIAVTLQGANVAETVKLRLATSRFSIDVQSRDSDNQDNGCVSVEIRDGGLVARLWSEKKDGDDPEEFVIQKDIVEAQAGV
jgi:hypothetical protein